MVLLGTDGFETPTFAAGNLDGQQGWVSVGGGAGSAVVQSGVAESGQQAVRVNRGANSSDFWAVPFSSAPQSGRFVSITWDMLVEPTGASTDAFGPFFGVNVFYDSSGGVAAVALLGVDATTGDVLFQSGVDGFLEETAVDVVDGEWANFRVELDFQLDLYNAFVDGALVASTPFVDDALVEINTFSDADIAAFAAAGDPASQAIAGTAYFDNFLIRDGLQEDYAGSGIVSAASYSVWRDNVGQAGVGVPGDGNADSEVNLQDYELWQSGFGSSNAVVAPSVTGGGALAIPEPTSLFLAMLLLTSLPVATRGR